MDGNTGLLVCDAYADLKFIRYSQATSKAAIQLLASVNDVMRPSLELQIQQNMRFALSSDDERVEYVFELLKETAEKSVEDDFQILRRQSLVVLCASIEHLIKCFVAEWLQYQKEQVSGLEDVIRESKVPNLVRQKLKNPTPENLYYIADQLYKHHVSIHHKSGCMCTVSELVNKHLPHQQLKFLNEIRDVVSADIDEAFQVRNCMVHNGAKPNYNLSQSNNAFKSTVKISISQLMMQRYFNAVEGVAKGLYECSYIGCGL